MSVDLSDVVLVVWNKTVDALNKDDFPELVVEVDPNGIESK